MEDRLKAVDRRQLLRREDRELQECLAGLLCERMRAEATIREKKRTWGKSEQRPGLDGESRGVWRCVTVSSEFWGIPESLWMSMGWRKRAKSTVVARERC